MYYKQFTGRILVQRARPDPDWIQWVHRQLSDKHSKECLTLDGCWFLRRNAPAWPHHPYCHCVLEPLDTMTVQMNASAYSDYRKFDPYLFNTRGDYTHNKEKLFQAWGYSVEDARWLQTEMERQAREKYIAGAYSLGRLNDNGQRINIRITIPRKDRSEDVSFVSGWMVYPNGKIQLTTPYGGA